MIKRFYTSFYAIINLIHKEFLVTIKDPRSRVILIMPVLIQGLLFGYTATYNLERIPYAIVDESHSPYASDLAARLDGSGIFRRMQTLGNASQIRDVIDQGEVMLVLVIPQDFADTIASGQTASVQVITDGRNPTTSGLAAGYVSAIAASYSAAISASPPLITIQDRTWYNPNQITRWMFLPSLIPMIALTQVLILSGLSVAREREQGTFDQLLVTPLRPYEILVGKAVPPVCIGLIQATIMICLAVFWFGVSLVGSLVTLYLTIFIFLLSCVGIGLSISAISKTMQQVMVYCFVFLLPMLLLSGLATPIRNMPEMLQYGTYINPMRFAIEAIRRIYLEGTGITTIAPYYIPMLLISAVTLPLAAWLFRRNIS